MRGQRAPRQLVGDSIWQAQPTYNRTHYAGCGQVCCEVAATPAQLFPLSHATIFSPLLPAGVCGGVLLITLLFATPLFQHLSKNTQGAIIIVGVLGLFDLRAGAFLWRVSSSSSRRTA